MTINQLVVPVFLCPQPCFLCLVAAVDSLGFLVELGSLLAGNEALESEVLSCLHKGLGPLGETVAFVGALSGGVGLLRHDLPGAVLHQVLLLLTGRLNLLLGSTPNLVSRSADGLSLGPSLASGHATAAAAALASGASSSRGAALGSSSAGSSGGHVVGVA